MKQQKLTNILYISFNILILIAIVGIFILIGTWAYNDSKPQLNCTSNYTAGVNDTLMNNTLMLEVANKVNLYNIQKYGSPIVVYQGKIYAFKNYTEVYLK